MKRFPGDRRAGVLLLAVAVAAAAYAFTFDTAFIADPLGPRAAPLLMAGVLGLAGLVIAARPGPSGDSPDRRSRTRIGLAIAALLAYAITLELIGFVFSTTCLIVVLARMLGGRPVAALLAGGVFSAAIYYLFVFALDVPLPIGRLFPFLGG